MRSLTAALTILLAMSVSAFAALPSAGDGNDPLNGQPSPAFDWDQWQRLPVQDGGRRKPLETLARETFREISDRASLTDPETGGRLTPAAAYLMMLFEWQGWDQPPGPQATAVTAPSTAYFHPHRADKWDRAPLVSVDGLKLRRALGMAKDRKHISPLDLSEAMIRDPNTGRLAPFTAWAQALYYSKEDDFNEAEKKQALELAQRLASFQALRMGQGLAVIPIKGDKLQRWRSLADLMRTDFHDQTDPTGELRRAKQQFRKARTAYLAGRADSFNQASASLIAALRTLGPQLGEYPQQRVIDLEVTYNHWAPLRLAWIFTLIASISLLLGIGTRWKACYISALTALGVGLAAMLIGLGIRWVLKGHPPVTNLYESVVFAGFGTVLFGLAFGLRPDRQGVLAVALVVATIILALADGCPSVLDPAIRPLPPVLRSRLWLVVHVMTIMLSYAAFALALGTSNVTLGFYLVGSKRQETIKAQSQFTYKSLQAGVLLLLLGTFLGAAWADYSWGRFWGWDPKEVWALITLLGYLAILHARYAGWVGNRGLAAWSVICFTLVLMTWYGVNFFKGGLHNYALGGDEGPFYVLAAVGLQLLYVAAAVLKSAGYFRRSPMPV